MTTPAGLGNWKEKGRPRGMNSFAFMWSIPNVSFWTFFSRPGKQASKAERQIVKRSNAPLASNTLVDTNLQLTCGQYIPLGPEEVARMWSILKEYQFTSTHGAFPSTDIFAEDVKGRVLESMKIQIRNEGYSDHKILSEDWIVLGNVKD